MNELPDTVDIVEMLPRDGFQRHDEFVPTEEKVEIIDQLSETGVSEIEVTSFTHPEVVPTLRDAEDVVSRITRNDDVTYRALVPNDVGMKRARDVGVDKANALITVSEEYNRRNQNMTIEENISEIGEIVSIAHDADIQVEAGIGMSFFDPYQGRTPKEKTLRIVESVIDQDVDEVTLATSMGMANPQQIRSMLGSVYERWPDIDLGLHLHDTNGMSLANTLAAMEMGVRRFDASLCGLGGGVVLPEEMEGIGNTPTEDLLNMLREMEIKTGVDFNSLHDTAVDVQNRLDLGSTSHVLKGGTRENVLSTVSGDS
jgi:hydroxymethylglutaryl-CoA lyase